MKKVFLSLVAVLLCGVTFAQTPIEINDADDFKNIPDNATGSYKLMADINLETYDAESNNFVIESFSGTFDGNGHTITYQAQFIISSRDKGLFETVSGTIKNLTLNASVTISSGGTTGGTNWVNVGLLCGTLTGTLENCHATNCNINSVITTSNGQGISVGLLVGKMSGGTLNYSSGVGNVTGNGRVGGLVGEAEQSVIYGCSFIGEVVAVAAGGNEKDDAAGGICGKGGKSTTINLCYVNADITATDVACGIVCTSNQDPTVTNCYATGSVNGEDASSSFDITNSNNNSNSNNWHDGQINGNTITPESIANTLNTAANSDPNINFGVAGDEVIFGVVSTDKVCETPTDLTITPNNAGAFTASWTSANANNTIIESHWHWSLTGGDAYDSRGEASSATPPATSVSVDLGTLPASSTPYTFMVYTDCSETVNGLTSSARSQQFYVDCPAPTGLTASNITDNGFTISWTADVDCQVSLYENEEILVGNEEIISSNPEKTKSFTGLDPQTQYKVTVKAKCGNEYVEQASINVTTARLAAPTGLTVTTSWNGSAGDYGGSATISWDIVAGLIYEYEIEKEGEAEPEAGNTVSVFEKTGLGVGNYTARVRARYQNPNNNEEFYYSDWSEIAYTVSNPPAPSNPQISFAHQGNGIANVTISWTAGSNDSPTWTIKEGETPLATGLSSATYTISGRNVGSSFTIGISETTTAGRSEPLLVNVTVPCADATLPTSIETNQTTATFTFASEQPNRKIVIGSTEHDASSASEILSTLSSGTNYNYTIREYCTPTLYSEVSSTFVTKSCYAVTGLQAQATGVTSGSASWTSQSELSGLNYKVRLLQGVNEISSTEQTETSITFSGLQPSTTYTVEVSEQCGEGWGEERTITFTTQGAKTYISAKTGNFSDGATWIGGQIPSIGENETASITINAEHTVTLDVTFVLRDKITFTNNGVLSIGQKGELINITNNNVGGIVEIVTPIKAINKWTFVGAPFAGYQLGAVMPVSGSDIAMVKYNYADGVWSNNWATINTSMEAAEGTFAWPFYGGAVTFTTYGDLCTWDATANNGEGAWVAGSYNFDREGRTHGNSDYALNNDDVRVEKTIIHTENNANTPNVDEEGNWMALANPYPAKLSVSEFLGDNALAELTVGNIQGEGVYLFNGTSFDYKNSGDILMTEGFFVNFVNAGPNSVTFTKDQLSYNATQAKSSANEFIELTLQNGNDKVRVYFAHNQDAEQGYDIFDANKMFATTGVAEPYFVTDGIALIKEEVAELPYYATMNVRSQQDTVMNFVLTNLPEGYAVSIIDGEEVIDLVEGGVYSTEILTGENADRFKVLVKKNVGLADVEELDVTIINSNRHISITAQEDVKVTVYNTLGQRVFETEKTDFVLGGVASGAYVVKVQGAKAAKSQKIIVE